MLTYSAQNLQTDYFKDHLLLSGCCMLTKKLNKLSHCTPLVPHRASQLCHTSAGSRRARAAPGHSAHKRQVQEAQELKQGTWKANRDKGTRPHNTDRSLALSCWPDISLCITFSDSIIQKTVWARTAQPAVVVREKMDSELFALLSLAEGDQKRQSEKCLNTRALEHLLNAAFLFCDLCYRGQGQHKMKKNIQGQKKIKCKQTFKKGKISLIAILKCFGCVFGLFFNLLIRKKSFL